MDSTHINRPQRVLLAPDSFKGTLSSHGVVEAMRQACEQQWPGVEIDACPLADGGEGLIAALKEPMDLALHTCRTRSPQEDSRAINATWGSSSANPTQGVIEAAEVVGLGLTAAAVRSPLESSSHGLGDVIQMAVDGGAKELIIGLGGTGTIDGGAGAMAAIGVRFENAAGQTIPLPIRGGDIGAIAGAHVPDGVLGMFEDVSLRLAVDVRSPLLGSHGAAKLFGPQKGASPEAIATLEESLGHLARVLRVDPNQLGMGAAGGMGVALVGLLGASIEEGVSLVLDTVGFDERCARADLVLTGEGSLDNQSRLGKCALAVAERAATRGVETIAVVGRRSACFGEDQPFAKVISLVECVGEDQAMANPADAISQLRF